MAGYRGLLAPWIGGAATPSQAGYRGLLAPWIGGASSPPDSEQGYRSLLAFWSGGASVLAGEPPEPPTPIPGGGRYVVEIPKGIAARTIEEQDELLLLLSTCRGQIIQADL